MEGCHGMKIFFSCQKPAFHSFYIFIPPMFTNNYCSVVFSFGVCWELISSSIMHVNAFMDREPVWASLYDLVMGDSKQCFHFHEKFVGLMNFKNHKMEFMLASNAYCGKALNVYVYLFRCCYWADEARLYGQNLRNWTCDCVGSGAARSLASIIHDNILSTALSVNIFQTPEVFEFQPQSLVFDAVLIKGQTTPPIS